MIGNIKNSPITTILGAIWVVMATAVYWVEWPVSISLEKELIGLAVGVLLMFSPDSILSGLKSLFKKKTSE